MKRNIFKDNLYFINFTAAVKPYCMDSTRQRCRAMADAMRMNVSHRSALLSWFLNMIEIILHWGNGESYLLCFSLYILKHPFFTQKPFSSFIS